MNNFVIQYFGNLLAALVPFGIGTLLIGLSPIINKSSEGLGSYSKIIGIIISVISLVAIIYNLSGIIGQYI